MIAAVTNQGEMRFIIYPGGPSAERLIVFVQRWIRGAPRKVFLIPVSSSVHAATVV